uniref:Uncharacterized protein n=1 Tax=Anguilla anguilla TaxID=7936 RepID=A0A0E9SRS3_ANGAN
MDILTSHSQQFRCSKWLFNQKRAQIQVQLYNLHRTFRTKLKA